MPCVAIDMFSKFLGHIPKINKQLRKFSLSDLNDVPEKDFTIPYSNKTLIINKNNYSYIVMYQFKAGMRH